jgi:hypothetical protein
MITKATFAVLGGWFVGNAINSFAVPWFMTAQALPATALTPSTFPGWGMIGRQISL